MSIVESLLHSPVSNLRSSTRIQLAALRFRGPHLSLALASSLTVACGGSGDEDGRDTPDDGTQGVQEVGGDEAGDAGSSSSGGNTGPDLTTFEGDDTEDESGEDTGLVRCGDPNQEACNKLDLLFVIDNSGTMGAEQINLSRNFGYLAEQLTALKLPTGEIADIDVNMMFTTTDLGHLLCDEWQPEDHKPAQGEPVNTACVDRLDHFTSVDPDHPVTEEDACTNVCDDDDMVPDGQWINFRGTISSNVPDDDVAAAMGCIGPQGIDGCGFESPLGAMERALNPNAPWNMEDKDGNPGFLRDDAILAIVIVSDEADCTIDLAEGGYDAFVNPTNTEFWASHPDEDDGGKRAPTSAICWNAGVECDGPDDDGVYSNCRSADHDVLVPLDHYRDMLIGYFREQREREVVMLGILGVPEVTKHSDEPPYEPIEGGVHDLVYRDWTEDDIVGNGDPAIKQYELGIGPGCTGRHGGEFTGQAVPPVRIKELCESLNLEDADDPSKGIRCCIESICDDDFSGAIKCLAGLLQTIVPPS